MLAHSECHVSKCVAEQSCQICCGYGPDNLLLYLIQVQNQNGSNFSLSGSCLSNFCLPDRDGRLNLFQVVPTAQRLKRSFSKGSKWSNAHYKKYHKDLSETKSTKVFSVFCYIKLLSWNFLFIWILPPHKTVKAQ